MKVPPLILALVLLGMCAQADSVWWRFEVGVPGEQIVEVENCAGPHSPLYNRIYASAVYSADVAPPPAGADRNEFCYRGLGIGSFIETRPNEPVNAMPLDEFTIEVSFRVCAELLGAAWVPVLSKFGAPVEGSDFPPLVIKITPDRFPGGGRRLWFQYLDSKGAMRTLDMGVVDANEWVHLAVIRKSETLYGQRNGKPAGQIAAPHGVYPSNTRWIVGGYAHAGLMRAESFPGWIDEIRISPVALPPHDLLY